MMYKMDDCDSYRNKRPITYYTQKDYPRKVKIHVNQIWV